MRTIRTLALVAAVVALSPCAAFPQEWPSRPGTMLVPFPAGGTADILARGVAQALSDELNQPFVVENRPGAGGNLAAAAVTKAAPDGHILLFASQAQAAFNKLMFSNLQYDPAELTPVLLVIKSPMSFVAGKDTGITSLKELIERAKAEPGKLSMGQSGVGSMSHVSFELLQQKTGIKLNGVPYKGGAPMVTDLLGGHLPLASNLGANFVQLAKDKKVRMLAIASSRRMADLQDVPTVEEQIGQPFEASAWFALMMRAGTPAEIVQKVNAIANRYLQSPKVKELMANASVEPGGGTPADAAAFVKLELERWAPVIKAANISLK